MDDTWSTFQGVPSLVRFALEDRTHVTPDDVKRIERFGFVAVFTRNVPTIVGNPYDDEPEVTP